MWNQVQTAGGSLAAGSAQGGREIMKVPFRLDAILFARSLEILGEGRSQFRREPNELLHGPWDVPATGVDDRHIKCAEAPVRHEFDELSFLCEFADCQRREVANTHTREKRVREAGRIIDRQIRLDC